MYSRSVVIQNRVPAKRRYAALALALAITTVMAAGVISGQLIDSGVNGGEALRSQPNQSVSAIQTDNPTFPPGEKQTVYLVDSPRDAVAMRHSLPEFTDLPRGNALIVSSPEETMLAEWYLAHGDDGIQIVDLRVSQSSHDSVPGYRR